MQTEPKIRYRKTKKGYSNLESLCFSCINGYANKCFKYPVEQRYWIQDAIAWKDQRKRKKDNGVYLWLVLECDFYELYKRKGTAGE